MFIRQLYSSIFYMYLHDFINATIGMHFRICTCCFVFYFLSLMSVPSLIHLKSIG
jgi:hypothetical protein